MRKVKKLFCCVFLWMGLIGGVPSNLWASGEAILAVVNREVITEKDLKDYLKSVYMQLKVENLSDKEINEIMTEYEKKGIEQIIEDKLVLFAVEQSGIILRTELIDQKIQDIQSKYPTYKDFEQALKREGMVVSDIRKKIENQIKGQIIINREVRSKIIIKPQEVNDWFEKNKASLKQDAKVNVGSVFVTTQFDSAQAKKKIQEAQKKINEGMPFEEVAKQYSDLPSIGVVPVKDLKPEIVEIVSGLRVGDVSPIITVANGFYLFKLNGRREEKEADLNEVRRDIQQNLFEEKFKEKFQEWISQWREKAYVEIKVK